MYESLRVDRTRIVLDAEEKVVVQNESEVIDVLRVSATNLGKRPSVVNALWLGLGSQRHAWYWNLVPRRGRPSPQFEVCGQPIQYAGACDTIPCKLESGDQINVMYLRSTVEARLQDSGFETTFVKAFTTTDELTSRSRRLQPARWERARSRVGPPYPQF
jgi:hypothetical protein